jgi:hypothetical protein
MRTRAFRRHQERRHYGRRVSEFRNQNQWSFDNGCITERSLKRFKEHPATCSLSCCGNRRRWDGPTLQERRHELEE